MKRLLVVWHTQFGGTAQLAAAASEGARSIEGIGVDVQSARDAGVDDVLASDAMLLATSENFGSLAGMTKDFLERIYYPCEGRLEGRAYSVIVCASNDGAGAMLQTDRIMTGLAMRKVHPGLVYRSGLVARPQRVPPEWLDQARELGATLAAGLDAGLW